MQHLEFDSEQYMVTRTWVYAWTGACGGWIIDSQRFVILLCLVFCSNSPLKDAFLKGVLFFLSGS